MILTVSKVVNDLERIGDEVKKVAYKASQARGSDRLTRVRYYDVVRARRTRRRCCGWRSTRFARLDRRWRPRSSASTTRSTWRSRRSCAS
jgi:hypothetical protein